MGKKPRTNGGISNLAKKDVIAAIEYTSSLLKREEIVEVEA